jgi:hypothetical protein
MLDIKKCTLVVVDVQGKLARLMHDKEVLFKNIQILIKAWIFQSCGASNVPILSARPYLKYPSFSLIMNRLARRLLTVAAKNSLISG